VRWSAVTPDGTFYFVDARDLLRVGADGRIVTVARDLSPSSLLAGRHVLFGIWFDRAGNVYVADYPRREVKRVDRSGRVMVVAESTFPWAPTGGAFAPDGALWLLEYSVTNQVRARRVAQPR
jgi:sugar lactone lactonase YvrE